MRNFAMLLALAGLTACDRNGSEEGRTSPPATPAELSYEGATYKDEAAKIAHGKRLATILDCTGCHGENLQGKNVTADDPNYGDMNAPNVTLLLDKYSDADFDQLIRHGLPKDGREFWFMPVKSFQFLSDADFAALVAYIRTFKPAGRQLPPIKKGKGFHEDLERGFGNAQQQLARYRANLPADMGKPHEWGRFLVKTTCTACHNSTLQGYEGFTPNLDVAGAYSEAELTRLLTTGEGKVKKDLGMMSDMARNHFSQLTSRERDAIVDYVLARAGRQQPAGAN